MNNGPDLIHRTAGAAEISGQRMVTNQKEDRRRDPGKRKGRRRRAPDAGQDDGVIVDLSQDKQLDQGDPSDPSDPSDSSDQTDQTDQDTHSIDCLA